jgi:transcriptional regulator with XRE-family HTH domain
MPAGTTGPPNPFAAAVASEIRAEMARLDIKQIEIVERTGLKQSYLSTRLSGGSPLNLNDLDELAGVLKISPSTLLRRAEERLRRA